MVTSLVFDEMYLKHEMGYGHPERPERLRSAMRAISETDLLGDRLVQVTPVIPELDEILEIHDADYIDGIRQRSQRGGGFYTMDTSVNEHTYTVALLAAGGGIQAVDGVMHGDSSNAFVLCRPPGHHAEHARAFGFCFINNVAVAARHLLNIHGLDRVMIVDYDAHHGNGTQNAFYSDSKVLYVGLHQDGRTLFPGSGFPNEVGEGEGIGYTVNLAMYPGAGDESYRMAFTEIIEPLSESFKPQFVLVSIGYDGHYRDPLTSLGLTSAGFQMMNAKLNEIARTHADGRIACFLEGGYDLEVIAMGAQNLVEELTGETVSQYADGHSESDMCTQHTRNLITELTGRLPLLN
ncbi:MAG: histone deacetylase family protein [Candidatus Thorarchaeota archaeon]